MKIEDLLSYELFIVVGAILVFGTFFKLIGFYDISSDWFWFIAGLGLVVEGTISLVKHKAFENKYKILSREEYERIVKKKRS